MTKQMCWTPALGHDRLILHLREALHELWKPYTAFPQHCVPDSTEPGASKGWTTFQKLRSISWELAPTGEGSDVSGEDVA